MFPDQQQQNGGQSYAPQPNPTAAPQQAANGQYAVVPPLPVGQNNGHSGHNPYEFIVNPNTPKASSPLAGGNGFFLRIALIVGGAVVLMIIAGIILTALKPGSSSASLTSIAEQQQEIARIALAATQQATGQDTQNFVSNVYAGITSDQLQVTTYLSSHGTKLSPKQLALDLDTKTDTLLSSAASANNYDSVVVQTLASQLNTYEGLLKTTYKQTSVKTTKTLVQSTYTNAVVLSKQAQALLPAN